MISWYFELWNEPDIFYWSGTAAEYCKLFDYTEHAVHEVLPEARLSGPAVTGIFAVSYTQDVYKRQEFGTYGKDNAQRAGFQYCFGND